MPRNKLLVTDWEPEEVEGQQELEEQLRARLLILDQVQGTSRHGKSKK